MSLSSETIMCFELVQDHFKQLCLSKGKRAPAVL